MDFKRFLNLSGVATRDDDTEDTIAARADVLGEIFPDDHDAEFLAEQIKAGHGPVEAIAAIREQHATELAELSAGHQAELAEAIARKDVTIADLTAERDAATENFANAEIARAEAVTAKETAETNLADYQSRPVVRTIAAELVGPTGKDRDQRKAELKAAYAADTNLQRQFRSDEAYAAYELARTAGRVR